jgi:hypothetical protein
MACTPSAPTGSVLSEVSDRLPSVRFERVALLAGALVVAACGGDGDAAPEASTTTTSRPTPTSTSTTTTTASPEDAAAAVLEAYERSWQDYARAADPPDPQAPYLAERHTGDALEAVREQLGIFASEGVGLRGTYRPAAEILELDETSARLRDCAIDDLQAVTPSGEVVGESGGVEVSAFAGMVLEDDVWKLATYEHDEEACG